LHTHECLRCCYYNYPRNGLSNFKGGFGLPHSLTSRQQEYLEFVRQYIRANESSPRLEEISKHFQVKSPTAHKILETLQSKGYLYFGRDPNSGFFIRLIERAGSAEIVMEVPIAGRVGAYGEVYDFPQNLGHFASVFVGAVPGNVVALAVTKDIPQASILSGDLIIFDLEKKPQPGDICIGPIGERFFLLKIASKTLDKETTSLVTAQSYPIPEDLTDPDLDQLLNWYPLAYDDETHDLFEKIAEEQDWPVGPIKPELILATALRLTRALAF
jgi:SOS-response transcriptional repressor LexA